MNEPDRPLVRVRDVYQPGLVDVDGAETLSVAARQMLTHDVGSLAVLENGVLAGMITERDLATALASDFEPQSTPVRVAMSRSVVTANLDEAWDEVARRMLELGFRHLPVVDEGKAVGMISIRDLMAAVVWD